MTVIWAFPDNVASLTAHRMAKNAAKADAVERQVAEVCGSRNIHGTQANAVQEIAFVEYMRGASPAMAVAEAVKAADKIVAYRKGLRDLRAMRDDSGPDAA